MTKLNDHIGEPKYQWKQNNNWCEIIKPTNKLCKPYSIKPIKIKENEFHKNIFELDRKNVYDSPKNITLDNILKIKN